MTEQECVFSVVCSTLPSVHGAVLHLVLQDSCVATSPWKLFRHALLSSLQHVRTHLQHISSCSTPNATRLSMKRDEHTRENVNFW